MNSAYPAFVKSLFTATLVFSAAASLAQEQKAAAPTLAKADPAKGSTLYANGDAARGLPACVSCHGAAGNSTMAANPKLAGQNEVYLTKQLVNFTTPERPNPIMTTYAKMLTDEEKKNVAVYLSTQVQKPGAAKNKASLELGKTIYRGGIAEKHVPACASCHGAAGAGVPVQYPRLGGQHQDYTVAQLTAFRTGGRKNSPQMDTIAKRMSDDEMKAVADYIAGLK
jgi:cytochrome c553